MQMVFLRSFQWLHYLYNMFFSTYNYYNAGVLRRVAVQKHAQLSPTLHVVTLEVANSNLTSVEDPEILQSLKALELITGQKAILPYTGSRYVGTAKKAFFFASVSLKKHKVYSFLLFLALFLLPNLQKLGGRYTVEWVRSGLFSICCKDSQLFEGYFSESLKSDLRVTLRAKQADSASFVDLLQFLKFNIQQ